MARDPFGTQGDLGSDFSGTVAKAEFVNGQFGWQAVVTTKLDEPFVKNDGTMAMEFPTFVRLGAGWSSPDGNTLKHESGDADKLMDARSQYGKLIQRVAELPGARAAVMANNPEGLYAVSSLEGLRFHWMTEGAGEAYSFTDKATGEQKTGKTRGQVMPVEFLGTAGAPVSGQVGAVAPSVDPEGLGINPETLETLRAAAQVMTYGAWVNEGLKHIGVAGVQELIGDERYYKAMVGPIG